MIFVFLSNSSV